MAPLSKEITVPKLVQEIVKGGDQIPEEYVRKDGFPKAIDAPDNLLIDFALLSSSSSPELAKLRSALSEWGCFQIINHGIENSFLEELIEVSHQFFALSLEEKLKCSVEDDLAEGYGSDNRLYSGIQIPSWNDRLFLTLHPKHKIRHQCWPQKPENLREMINEYTKKITQVSKVMCKAMTRSLNLENSRINFGKQGPTKIRFNLYPRCPCPEHVLGTKPHSDATTVTYLLPEKEVEGLEILKDEQWYKVPAIPGAIVLNIGDFGEAFTNGVFKSVMHRVSTNSVKDRISVAVFFMPDIDEQIIEPLRDLVTSNRPQHYKNFNISEYWPKFIETFKRPSRALDAFEV